MSRDSESPARETTTVNVRCFAELNDYLAPQLRFTPFSMPVAEGSTVAGLLTMLGIPQSEVDLVLRNGEAAQFETRVADGDRISMYPIFETFDIGPVQRLRSRPLRRPAFVLDVHLGKLASFLRMFGFDASYAPTLTDEQLISISLEEHRALLSKDRALLRDPRLVRSYAVKADNPREQIIEVVKHFDLVGSSEPLTRCLLCNVLLVSAAQETVIERIPARVGATCRSFTACPQCGRIYWEGTHHKRMTAFVADVISHAH